MTEETTATPPVEVQQAPATDRPAWLPEKFKSPEALAQAHAHLEKLLGSRAKLPEVPAESAPKSTLTIDDGDDAPADGVPEGTEAPTEGAPEGATQEAAKVVQAAGLDMAALNAEWAQHGELSAESLAKLEAVGITRAHVDAYVAGQQAIGEARRSDLAQSVGGEERLSDVVRWMSQGGISEAEGRVWNEAIARGDHELIKMNLGAIYAKYQQAGQDEPTGMLHGSRAGESYDVYADRAALHADIASPEYHKSQAFRDRVMEKLKRSSI
jgi:hypothetical protein